MLQRLQKAQCQKCQKVLLEHATFVLQKGCGLSKSEYVGTNRRAGPVESMTIKVLTEVLEIGERITNILNARDLSLRIKHVCFLHSPWLPHLYFPNSCHA